MALLTPAVKAAKARCEQQTAEARAANLPNKLRRFHDTLYLWTPGWQSEPKQPRSLQAVTDMTNAQALLREAAESLELLNRLLERERSMHAEAQERVDRAKLVLCNPLK